MPHHHKKKTNVLKNSSPKVEKTRVFPDSRPIELPVVAPTNYQEIHQEEVEALRSIYGDDFEDVQQRRSAWHVSLLSPIQSKSLVP